MIEWSCIPFEELSLQQLYDTMALRQLVFVVEQDCPYLDADGKDQASWHMMGYKNEELVAYSRVMPKGISYEKYCSIGRVVTAQSVRREGVGKTLMEHSISWCKKLFPAEGVKISAQSYLLKFYQSFAFQPVGEEYMEDGIPHTAMILKEA